MQTQLVLSMLLSLSLVHAEIDPKPAVPATPDGVLDMMFQERLDLETNGSSIGYSFLAWKALGPEQQRAAIEKVMALVEDSVPETEKRPRKYAVSVLQGMTSWWYSERAEAEKNFATVIPRLKARYTSARDETEREQLLQTLSAVVKEESDIRWLGDKGAGVESYYARNEIAEGIAKSTNPKAVAYLVDSLKTGTEQHRGAIYSGLTKAKNIAERWPEEKIHAHIERIARDDSTWEDATKLLEQYPGKKTDEYLKKQLREVAGRAAKNPGVHEERRIITLLDVMSRRGLDTPELYHAVQPLVTGEVKMPSRSVIISKLKAMGAAAVPDLTRLVGDEDREISVAAMTVLVELGVRDETLLSPIKKHLDSVTSSSDVDLPKITRALAKLVGTKATPVLEAFVLKFGEPSYQIAEAMNDLASLGPNVKVGRKVLKQIAESKNPDFPRHLMVQSLGGLLSNHPQEIAALVPTLNNQEKEALAAGLGKNPEAAVKLLQSTVNFREHPTEFLGMLVDIWENHRETLPTESRAEVDKHMDGLLDKALGELPVGANSACEALCSIWKNRTEWLNQTDGLDMENFASSFAFTGPYEAAIGGLYGLFSSRAAHYCEEKPLGRERSLEEFSGRKKVEIDRTAFDLQSSLVRWALRDSIITQAENKAYTEYLKGTLASLDDGALKKEDVERAIEFTEKMKHSGPIPSYFVHPATSYLKQFLILWLRSEISEKRVTDEQRAVFRRELAALEKSVNEDLVNYRDRQVNQYGSGLITFAYAAAASSVEAVDRKAIQNMKDVLASASGPLSLPYEMDTTALSKDWQDELRPRANPRGAAARAVPFHLALYLHSEPKAEARKNLIAAVENFGRHMPQLALQIARNDTHAAKDGLAPYYFHPALPFYTSALQTLLEDQAVPESVKKESLLPLQEKARKTLVNLTLLSAGPSPLQKGFYPNSKEYVSPLMGLALLPLLQECRGKPAEKSSGILVPPVAAGDPPGKRQSSPNH